MTATPSQRPRLAAVVTAIHKYLHPQHIVDRFLDGYGWNGSMHRPAMDLVSLYVDQRGGDGDLTQDRADRHPQLRISPTIADALTLGTGKLAVDGVVVVGEHGTYPRNEYGTVKFPHYEFFQQITEVFRSSGRSVPYFNDKELSWKWEWSKQMADTSHELGFPLQSGSSLPVTWRLPSVEMPMGAPVKEALSIAYGPVGSYDFHALETIQCMVERRAGGESGVQWLQAYRGERFWQAQRDGVWSPALFRAALSRSLTLRPGRSTFTDVFPTVEEMQSMVPDPVAYHYQHTDGLRSTMILLNGLVRDFNFAATIEGQPKAFSTQMYLPMPDGRTTLASFFSPLVYAAEQMFLTGKSQYPIERNLLTSGLVAAGVQASGGSIAVADGRKSPSTAVRLETPHLAAVRYQPYPNSTYWRS